MWNIFKQKKVDVVETNSIETIDKYLRALNFTKSPEILYHLEKVPDGGLDGLTNRMVPFTGYVKDVNGYEFMVKVFENRDMILLTTIRYNTETHYFGNIGFDADSSWKVYEPTKGEIILSLTISARQYLVDAHKMYNDINFYFSRMTNEHIPAILRGILKNQDPVITNQEIEDYLQSVVDLGNLELNVINERNKTYRITLSSKLNPSIVSDITNFSDVLSELSIFLRRMRSMSIKSNLNIDHKITITLTV